MQFIFDHFGTITDAVKGHRVVASELAAAARAGAAKLAALGAKPGANVLICHGGTPRFFADLFAVWTSGAAASCLNPETTASELERIVDFLKPVAVLVDGEGEGSTGGCPVIDLSNIFSGREVAPIAASLDDDALILFTSGTTGEPKGVVLTFRALLARMALNRAFIGNLDLAITLCVLPTHFGHGLIGNSLTPLFAGADLVLAAGNNLKSVARLGDIVDHFGVTFLSSVPAFWKLALKAAKPPRQAKLSRIHIGSAPLSAQVWSAVMDWSGTRKVVNMYGLTEAANWIAGASADEQEPQDGLIGRVWGGAAALRGEDGRLSATGEGDLVVQTPSLMKGYLHRADLTAVALRDGWLSTGDAGRIDADGMIRLTGRRKHEINRAGLKVHPEDIDILLERHPDISESCAFGMPDPIMGEAVGVAVVLNEGSRIDVKALRAWTAERLVAEKIPDSWYIVSQIPKSDRGKVSRDQVSRACRDNAAASAVRAPGDAA